MKNSVDERCDLGNNDSLLAPLCDPGVFKPIL